MTTIFELFANLLAITGSTKAFCGGAFPLTTFVRNGETSACCCTRLWAAGAECCIWTRGLDMGLGTALLG